MTGPEAGPRIPDATYRLQFNGSFTFRNATAVLSYLHDLGISDIYASPYFRAKPGSLHGYDIIDHRTLNPEIGTADEQAAMTVELQRLGMGQVLDIVPNHMCVDSSGNAWWMDVLENGPSSPYARYFDIDWMPVKKELRNKVLIPVLGDQYGNVLENRELRLSFAEGAFFVTYYEHRFPLRPQSGVILLEHRIDDLKAAIPPDDPDLDEYLSIITALRHLPPYTVTDGERVKERVREKEVIKRRLAALCEHSTAVLAHISRNVEQFNGIPGEPRSFDQLDGLMNDQVYRLSHWRVATEEINYRRFFDINNLGAIRMEYPAVFDETHALVMQMVHAGSVTGLRVDHPDGLYNPAEYFHRLQRSCFIEQRRSDDGGEEERKALMRQYDEQVLADLQFKPFYIVGEKILTRSERMPEDWPIHSTTGYVFMNSVNGIFVDSDTAKVMDTVYEKFIRFRSSFADIMYEKRKLVMRVSMSSEINMLGHYLNDISEQNRHTRDFTLNSLTGAITEVIACFPVYRTYTNSWAVSERDQLHVEHAVSRAKRKNPAFSESIFEFLKDVLSLRFPKEFSDREKAAWLDFVMRFQQITGPVMAKGVEDTAFYVYHRLVSLNEVGGSPDRYGTPLETFHGQNIERKKNWPNAMISTATHDAKRGEDVRARINVLSEVTTDWAEHVRRWARLNRKRKTAIDGQDAPDRNDEYLLYQTLIGAWPMEGEQPSDDFVRRIKDYMIKACREAKVNTSWISPNGQYESALLDFIGAILERPKGKAFLEDFLPFQRMISHYGAYNALSQALLKVCAPGVPDIYQGTELWDLSLVDPDNRRTVDYDRRIQMLRALTDAQQHGSLRDLAWNLSLSREDGRIKLYTLSRALRFRRERRELFLNGAYLPLSASGEKAAQVCAFERTWKTASVIVAVPRLLTRLISGTGSVPFSSAVWGDTELELPEIAPGTRYQNVFTGEELSVPEERKGLLLADIFGSFPVALLDRLA